MARGKRMIAHKVEWMSPVLAAIVGVGLGVLIAVLAGLGSGSRLVIGVGVGLLIGGGLLALFDRLIVRRVLVGPGNSGTTGQPAVPAFDPQTGEPLLRGATSSFFGLSLEVWSLVMVGVGILVVGVGVVLYLAA